MDIWGKVSCQFGNPTGILGKVAGFIMSHRGSNLERIDWAIELLKLKSDDRVLEIGFGPGIAIEKMETIASNGLVYGLDHSTLMYRQASSRNRKAIAAGTIRLFLGSVADIPKFEFQFDKVLDINSFQFWDEPVDRLRATKKNVKKPEPSYSFTNRGTRRLRDDSANETAKKSVYSSRRPGSATSSSKNTR